MERRALERGVSYLRGHRASSVEPVADVSALIVLDYLQRKYALASDLAFASAGSAVAAGMAGGTEGEQLWVRFLDSAAGATDGAALQPLTEPPQIEAVVMRALYCDRFSLPANYLELLEQLADAGGYSLTHAALARKLACDNGCLSAAAAATLDERLTRGLHALLERPSVNPRYEELDVRYEALAVLLDLVDNRAVTDAEFDRVVAEQLSDGGWKAEADHGSSLHPTVLALWALLARENPRAPRISFARR